MKWLALLLLLSGCALVDPVRVCPVQLTSWSENEQTKAAAELDLLPPDSILTPMMEDYATMRNQARACLND